MRIVPSLVAATLCFACGSEDKPLTPAPEVRPPVRGAVGDEDLRVMLAEIASSKACEMIKGSYREGLTVAIDLCTGYQRFTLGRPKKGQLGPPNAGESFKQPIELSMRGMITFGPYFAPEGMHANVHSDGPLRVSLACEKDIEDAVQAFVHQKPVPPFDTLAEADIHGTGTLEVKPQRCKVVLVAQSLTENKVRFDWARPPREIAESTGGPAIHCKRKGTLSSASNAAGSGTSPAAAARRR